MSELLFLRRHRFDALHALLTGDFRRKAADTLIKSNHLRRDIGLPETPSRPSHLDLATPMVGLRR